MEHLTYQPSERLFRREIREIGKALDNGDWSAISANDAGNGDDFEPTELRFPWLGHDHEGSSWYHHPELQKSIAGEATSTYYGDGWNLDPIIDAGDQLDLRSVHPSLEDIEDNDEVVRIFAAFFQSWMFMSPLEDICGRPLDTSVFVYKDMVDGVESAWISTRNLPALLDAWWQRVETLATNEEEKRGTVFQARSCVIFAKDAFNSTYHSAHRPESTGQGMRRRLAEELNAIEPAISAFFEALLGYITSRGQDQAFYYQNSEIASKDHLRRIEQRGWCPFSLANAAKSSDIQPFLRYVDLAGWVHPSSEHSLCDSEKCQRNDTCLDTYVQRHNKPKCRCQFVKPDLEQVFQILEDGEIPIISFNTDTNSLEVQRLSDGSQCDYVAYSHVWADGLGGATEIGLPLCQAQFLQKYSPCRWFWIDSLCIPRRKYYRRKAIRLINSIFTKAIVVLVLDRSLQTLKTDTSSLEIAWFLIASGWMNRMWTFLEAFVSSSIDVCIVVSDGWIYLWALVASLGNIYLRQYGNAHQNPFPSVLVGGMLSRLGELNMRFSTVDPSTETSESVRFAAVWDGLGGRQTSRLDDQALVIGLLLGTDLQPILQIPSGEERMKALYESLRDVPWQMVLDPRPKIRIAPFRWAPRSWLDGDKQPVSFGPNLSRRFGICTQKGLRAKVTILRLNRLRNSTDRATIITAGDKKYRIFRFPPDSASAPSQLKFNSIIVNHFDHETPYEYLHQQRTQECPAAVSFVTKGDTSGLVAHGISTDFCISEFSSFYQPELAARVPKVAGRWEESEILFT